MTNQANIPECFRAIYSMNICPALSVNIRPSHLGDPAPHANGSHVSNQEHVLHCTVYSSLQHCTSFKAPQKWLPICGLFCCSLAELFYLFSGQEFHLSLALESLVYCWMLHSTEPWEVNHIAVGYSVTGVWVEFDSRKEADMAMRPLHTALHQTPTQTVS